MRKMIGGERGGVPDGEAESEAEEEQEAREEKTDDLPLADDLFLAEDAHMNWEDISLEEAEEADEADEEMQEISLEDEPPSLQKTLHAEALEEEHMFALGLLRYGGSWISTRDLETLNVEEEERRAFSQWTRASAQSKRAEIVQRFGQMSDEGVDELRELGDEVDELEDW